MRSSLTTLGMTLSVLLLAGISHAQPSFVKQTETVDFNVDQNLPSSALLDELVDQAKQHCKSTSGSVANTARSSKQCRHDLVQQVVTQLGSIELADLLEKADQENSSES